MMNYYIILYFLIIVIIVLKFLQRYDSIITEKSSAVSLLPLPILFYFFQIFFSHFYILSNLAYPSGSEPSSWSLSLHFCVWNFLSYSLIMKFSERRSSPLITRTNIMYQRDLRNINQCKDLKFKHIIKYKPLKQPSPAIKHRIIIILSKHQQLMKYSILAESSIIFLSFDQVLSAPVMGTNMSGKCRALSFFLILFPFSYISFSW